MFRFPPSVRAQKKTNALTSRHLHDPALPNRAFAIFLAVASLIALALLLAPKATAANGSWNVDASGNWSNSANWSGGTIADGAGFTGNITFNITGGKTVTIDTSSRTLGILNVGDTNNTHSYTIDSSGGATFTFDNTPNSANAQLNQTSGSRGDTISAPILLKSSLDISNSSTNLLTISGTIASSAASGTQTITNKGTASGGVTISGVVSDGVTGGIVAITQNSSSSALTLAGTAANTYTGLTTVSAGTLNLGKTNSVNAFGGDLTINGGSVGYSSSQDNQIPDSAKVTISAGSLTIGTRTETIGQTATATSGLALSGTGLVSVSSGTLNLSNSTTISGGSMTIGSGGQVNLNNSATMTGGAVTLTVASGSLTANTDFNFSGGTIDFTSTSVSSTAALNLRGGSGTGMTYSASGTSTAQITNSGGGTARVSLNNAASATTVFNIADSASLATEMNISAVISGGSGNALQKQGAGVLQLSAANTYSGGTMVSGGTLLINNTTGSGTGAGAVAVSNSGTALGGTGTISGLVTVNANAIIQGGTGSTGATQKLTLTGGLTLNDNSIIQLALGSSGAHSTLARTGLGAWTFDTNQAFNFIDLGAQTTTYDNIITGLASDPGTESMWVILNAGWTGTFTYDGANIDLNLTTVPEPGTWVAAALTLAAVFYTQRRRILNKLGVVT